MEQKLIAEKREGTGKGVARRLRASGRVPAVLYGHGMNAVSISVDSKELYHLLHHGGANVLIDLVVGKDHHLALAREVQRDHIKSQYVHVDFLTVRRDEKITVSVPVRVVGESVGVKAGGVLEHHLWDLEAECLPGDVPEAIEADISELAVGDSLKVADLVVPASVEILSSPEETVLAVVPPQAREVAEIPVEGVEGEVAEGAEGAPAEGAPPATEGGEGE
jgi:large subunit ribosomal protein L25